MKEVNEKLGLDRPATYQIEALGRLDESWSDWFEGMMTTVESGRDGPHRFRLGRRHDSMLRAKDAICASG